MLELEALKMRPVHHQFIRIHAQLMMLFLIGPLVGRAERLDFLPRHNVRLVQMFTFLALSHASRVVERAVFLSVTPGVFW